MSQTKIYVGNLAYKTDQDGLQQTFGACGEIQECRLIMDRDTGRSKGFAFITFADEAGVEKAMELNGTDLDGRQIRVSPAKEDGGSRRPPKRGGFQKRD